MKAKVAPALRCRVEEFSAAVKENAGRALRTGGSPERTARQVPLCLPSAEAGSQVKPAPFYDRDFGA